MVEIARPTIIAGNWKMHKTRDEAQTFVRNLIPLISNTSHQVYLGVPFTALDVASVQADNSKICIGAQNMHDAIEGAYTGEISAAMLKDVGAKFVILGHSERRHIFGETNTFINKKMKQAFSNHLQPILCFGETESERDAGITEQVLEKQLTECLKEVSEANFSQLILAYEPVWAIGTGKTASPQQAQEAHLFSRSILKKIGGSLNANKVPILYGGSVKPINIQAILEQSDIDGVLVGGASLEVEIFAQLVNFQTILHK